MNRRIARKVIARTIAREGRYRRTTLDTSAAVLARNLRRGLRHFPVVVNRAISALGEAMRDSLSDLVSRVARWETESLDRAITEWKQEHGHWPRFAWVEGPTPPVPVEGDLHSVRISVVVGDAEPPPGVVALDVDRLNRTEVSE